MLIIQSDTWNKMTLKNKALCQSLIDNQMRKSRSSDPHQLPVWSSTVESRVPRHTQIDLINSSLSNAQKYLNSSLYWKCAGGFPSKPQIITKKWQVTHWIKLDIYIFHCVLLSCRSTYYYSANSIYKHHILDTTAVQQLHKIHDMCQKYTSHPQEKLYPSSQPDLSFSRQFPWDRIFVPLQVSNSKRGGGAGVKAVVNMCVHVCEWTYLWVWVWCVWC